MISNSINTLFMTYKVTIEETVSQAFDIEAESIEDAYNTAIANYKKGILVVEAGECTYRQIQVQDINNGECTEWNEF